MVLCTGLILVFIFKDAKQRAVKTVKSNKKQRVRIGNMIHHRITNNDKRKQQKAVGT